MLVLNAVKGDPRVEREAAALAASGHEVVVLGVRGWGMPSRYSQDGFRVRRISYSERTPRSFSLRLRSPQEILDGTRDLSLSIARWVSPDGYVRLRDRYLRYRYGDSLPEGLELVNGELRAVRSERSAVGGAPHNGSDGAIQPVPTSDPSSADEAAASESDEAGDGAKGEAPAEEPAPVDEAPKPTKLQKDLHDIWAISMWNVSLARAAILEKADVYHCHDLNTLMGGVMAKAATGSRLVFDAHDLQELQEAVGVHSRVWRPFNAQIEQRLVRFCDGKITVNEGLARWLERTTGEDDWKIIRNLPAHLPAREEIAAGVKNRYAERKPGEKIALYHGGIWPGRGLEQLIAAAEYFDDNVRLWIRGGGPDWYTSELSELAEKAGALDRVTFLPPVPMRELVASASEADLGLMPYLPVCVNQYFSLPNKLFEYLAAGLPVICTDIPEVRHVVDEHQLGALVNMRRPREVAAAVNHLLGNEPLRKQMAENSLTAAHGPLHWNGEIGELLNLYSSLETERGSALKATLARLRALIS